MTHDRMARLTIFALMLDDIAAMATLPMMEVCSNMGGDECGSKHFCEPVLGVCVSTTIERKPAPKSTVTFAQPHEVS